jgi:polar amino acid transport system permease protein
MIIDLYGFGPALAAGALMTVKLALRPCAWGWCSVCSAPWPRLPVQAAAMAWRHLFDPGSRRPGIALGAVDLFRHGQPDAQPRRVFRQPDLQLSAFAAGVIALGLCFGAYATEVFRGAILAIPKGHREAGVALGLSKWRIFTKLIMPQMWRIALPGLGNLFMILMKDTALVSVIGLEEIMRHAQIGVTVSKQPFTFYLVAAVMYLA